MATLTQILQYSMSLLGETQRKIGEKNAPTDFTINGRIFDTGGIPIADNFGNATLWTAGAGGLTTFSYLLFTTDAAVALEFTNTVPATDERALVYVAAGAFLCIPSQFMGGFASNTSRLDGAALVLGTDYNSINEIRVQRDVAASTGVATIRLVLIS